MELEARGEVAAVEAGARRVSLSVRMLFALMLCLVSDLSMQRNERVVRVDARLEVGSAVSVGSVGSAASSLPIQAPRAPLPSVSSRK